MRARVIIIGLVLLLAAVGCRGGHSSGAAVPGNTAPGFTLPDLTGRSWDLADLKGRVVMVNFWATWCPPCRAELDSMQRLYQNPPGKNFQMLTVLVNDSPANAAKMVRKKGYNFPVLLDPEGSVGQRYGITGVPETFIIDSGGILQEKTIGGDNWDSPRARTMIKKYLD